MIRSGLLPFLFFAFSGQVGDCWSRSSSGSGTVQAGVVTRSPKVTVSPASSPSISNASSKREVKQSALVGSAQKAPKPRTQRELALLKKEEAARRSPPPSARGRKPSVSASSEHAKDTTRKERAKVSKKLDPRDIWNVPKASDLPQRLLCPFRQSRGKASATCAHFASKDQANEIFYVVLGKRKRSYLCRGKRLLRSYIVGYGRAGFGKLKEGDMKTPVGTYHISWMASRYEPKRTEEEERRLHRYQIRNKAAFCKHNHETNFSEFARKDGPPDEMLWTRSYGGKKATVIAINYPNKTDKAAGRTGSCIEIHASFHRRYSAGCVILAPRDVLQVYRCVRPGTRVELRFTIQKRKK